MRFFSNSTIFWGTCLISLLIVRDVRGQYDEDEEDDEEGSESEVEVPTTIVSTTQSLFDKLYNKTFMQQFYILTAHEKEFYKNETEKAAEKNATTLSPSNGTLSTTTSKPIRRVTTTPSRGQEIGGGVNGILGSLMNFDIPGIVFNALSIREDNEDVRQYVNDIMMGIFCSPLLQSLSTCRNAVTKPPKTKRPKPKTSTTLATSTIASTSAGEATLELANNSTIDVDKAVSDIGDENTVATTTTSASPLALSSSSESSNKTSRGI